MNKYYLQIMDSTSGGLMGWVSKDNTLTYDLNEAKWYYKGAAELIIKDSPRHLRRWSKVYIDGKANRIVKERLCSQKVEGL